jgi:uncharacterized SAM-binding protein YcdF (DUF218 family)
MAADLFFVFTKVLGTLALPSNLLTIGIGVGAVLLCTRWRTLGRRLAIVFAGLLAVVGILPVGSWLLMPLENRFPADPPLPLGLAGVIVLGGAPRVDVSAARGQPVFSDAAERMTALVELEKRLPGIPIVFTGGSATLSRSSMTEAEIVAQFLERQRVDPGRVILEARSRNTHENAVFTHALIAPEPGSCWLLVTSAYHMPRSVGVFREAGWRVLPYPVDFRTTGEMDVLDARGVGQRLSELDLAARAWAALAVYALTGRASAFLPGPREPACS